MKTKDARQAVRQLITMLSAAQKLEEVLKFQEQREGAVDELKQVETDTRVRVAQEKAALKNLQITLEKKSDEYRTAIDQLDVKLKNKEHEIRQKVESKKLEVAQVIDALEREILAKHKAANGKIDQFNKQVADAKERASSAESEINSLKKRLLGNG